MSHNNLTESVVKDGGFGVNPTRAGKKILVINGHPDIESFNYALSKTYYDSLLDKGLIVNKINIAELEFNPNLAYGYRKKVELEPDLNLASELIKKSDHIVWFFPMWWYGLPALMKGFVDRIFLPGSFFRYQKGKAFPEKLLKGKTARLVVTADTPRWYDFLFMRSPLINQFKKGTLEFCGISPVHVTYISPIKGSTMDFRKKWVKRMEELGRTDIHKFQRNNIKDSISV